MSSKILSWVGGPVAYAHRQGCDALRAEEKKKKKAADGTWECACYEEKNDDGASWHTEDSGRHTECACYV